MSTEWLLPLVTLLVGAALGFFFRAREFRREQRLRVYGEFVGAFLRSAHAGANLLSLHMTFGDTLFNENKGLAADLWREWADGTRTFEETMLRLRLIASRRVRSASEELETFLERNVRAVPPFRREVDPADWGDEAQVGPAHVDRVAVIRAREFADVASRDVVFSREA